jgi:hypothetical protein
MRFSREDRLLSHPRPVGEASLTREDSAVNVVCLRGTVTSDPTITYTKNAKPQTRFELTVPNDDQPWFSTTESILVVGQQAEAMCEQLDKGLTVELSGKLQRGIVVCFHVTKKTPQDDRTETGEGDISTGVIVQPEGMEREPTIKARRPRVPKLAREPWPRGLVSEN